MSIFSKMDNSMIVNTFKQLLDGAGLKIVLSDILQARTIQ